MTALPGPAEVSARLRRLAQASNLRRDLRLETKVDLRPQAVSRRLQAVGRVTSLCLKLGVRESREGRRLAERARELGGDCAALARLRSEEERLLRGLPGGDAPGIADLEALSEVRGEARHIAEGAVGRVREDGQLLRHLTARYAGFLGDDVRERGFPLTPAVRAVERDLVRHLPHRPVCLLGPPGFPLEELARHAIGVGSTARADVPPSSGALVAACDLGRDGIGTLRHLLENGGHSAVLLTGFLDVDDWGMQRALCDLGVRRRVGLVLVEGRPPAVGGEKEFEGYALPPMEPGVASRLHFLAVPASHIVDERTLRRWLRDEPTWYEGLLPLWRLARALGDDTGTTSSPGD